jgi:hypothetical protein
MGESGGHTNLYNIIGGYGVTEFENHVIKEEYKLKACEKKRHFPLISYYLLYYR